MGETVTLVEEEVTAKVLLEEVMDLMVMQKSAVMPDMELERTSVNTGSPPGP